MIANSGARNPVESQFILLVEDHPEGIPRDDDRWEATMGGIAGIIVTQFASLRRGPNYLQAREKLGHIGQAGSAPGRMRESTIERAVRLFAFNPCCLL